MGKILRLTLHIGTEKTGTTSIQKALTADRARLAKKNILFPVLFGSSNHMELAVGASDTHPFDELQMIELERQQCSLGEYRERLRDAIRQEIAAGSFTQVIVSNEHCHSRVSGAEAVRRLISLFPVPIEVCEVIVYLRRQDRLAVSLYSTVLKLGGNGRLFPEVKFGQLPRYFDFNRVLDDYAQVIGQKKIKVRLYEPKMLVGGDVVQDFYNQANLGIEPSMQPRENESLSRKQALFLEEFNKRFPIIRDGKINKERGPIFEAIKRTGIGPRLQPERGSAMTFYCNFKEGNANIRSKYLSNVEREFLFDEDFSEYLERENDTPLNQADLFEFIEAIWRFRQRPAI